MACHRLCILFGSWICWDIKALQIDLTADEYIIGAVDLYLDILNMFLWLIICCLHCLRDSPQGLKARQPMKYD